MKNIKIILLTLIFCSLFSTTIFSAPYINLKLTYDLKTVDYNAERVYLEINGEKFNNDELPMEPIIIDGNTLVPAREVFEKLGAKVAWKGDKNEVDILYNNTFVVMYINNNNATVAGKQKTMNVPPKIINDKTMIPLRFCAEVIGLEVNWDNSTRTIKINNSIIEETTTETSTVSSHNPVIEETTKIQTTVQETATQETTANIDLKAITNISYNKSTGLDIIKFSGKDLKVDTAFPTSDTLILNFPNTKLSSIKGNISGGEYFKSCVYEYLTDNSVQATITLAETNITHSISTDNDGIRLSLFKSTLSGISYNYEENQIQIPKSSIDIDLTAVKHNDDYENLRYNLEFPFDLSAITGMGTLKVENDYISDVTILSENGNTTLQINEKQLLGCKLTDGGNYIGIKIGKPQEIYKNIIVLDPGHGGNKPGAIGNGLIEKDLTLSMCQKILELFEKNPDIKVYATRTTDVNPDFPERIKLANEIADIFISVHINSATSSTASGTEVHFYEPHTNSVGLTSGILAQELQNRLIANLGSVDRGVKEKQDIYVTRNTKIPSVLCEIGFISNPLEASKMARTSYQQSIAQAIYDGCVNIFKEYPSAR